MTIVTSFLLYATVFRIAVIGAGIVSVFLGYRLFVRGVMPDGATDATAEAEGIKLSVKNAAPGTCFALFGITVIVTMLVQGNPELVLEEVAGKVEKLGVNKNATLTSDSSLRTIRLKGPDDAVFRFNTHLETGFRLENSGDINGARSAYAKALSESEVSLRYSSSALNQVAWGYLQQQRFEEALAISRITAIVDPQNPVYCDTLSQIQLARGEIEEAIQWAEKAVSLAPGNELHQRTLAAARAAKGN